MQNYPESLERLIEELQHLPTVGPKTAQRLAFHVLSQPASQARALAEALIEVKEAITACPRCGNLAEGGECLICRDPSRDPSLLCVVATVRDLMALENSQAYHGLYHVLGGLISPLDGIGPDDLKIKALLERLRTTDVKEVIIATNPTVPGEATALYLRQIFKDQPGLKVTRPASGLPMGADMEYADELTLSRALSNRLEMGSQN